MFYASPAPGEVSIVSAYQHPYASLTKRELYGYGLHQDFIVESHQQPQNGGLEGRHINSLKVASHQVV